MIPRIKKGDVVYWNDPSKAQGFEHSAGQRTVTERRCDMLILDGDTEALHSECFLKSPYVCPQCGRRLYYEKYHNTREHYPLVCFGCDENFFFGECDKDLSYGHVTQLSNLFDSTFLILADNEEDAHELYTQAFTTFETEWSEGGIMDEMDFYEIYGSNGLMLKADRWWSGTDFDAMEHITGLRRDDYDPEDGYQAFVDACEKWWAEQDPREKNNLYKKYTK